MKLKYLLVLISISAACKSRQFNDSKGLVFNGTPVSDQDAEFNSTVFITSEEGGNCTGTFLGNNVILTAGHCLERSEIDYEPITTPGLVLKKVQKYVGFGKEAPTDKASFQATKNSLLKVKYGIRHPEYKKLLTLLQMNKAQLEAMKAGKVWGENGVDAAVLFFEGTPPPYAKPAKLLDENEVQLRPGEVASFAGYGLSSEGKTEDGKIYKNSGILIKGSSKISEIKGMEILMHSSEGVTSCNGDSGGPLFVSSKDGSGLVVVGIVSRGAYRIGENVACGKTDVFFTDARKLKKWVEEKVKSYQQ
jgi:hypothetical protein